MPARSLSKTQTSKHSSEGQLKFTGDSLGRVENRFSRIAHYRCRTVKVVDLNQGFGLQETQSQGIERVFRHLGDR
jgi:hypothetical protein